MSSFRLIVGLGNPTDKYQNTRHNVGFMVLDDYLKCHDLAFSEKKFSAKFLKTKSAIFLQPQTFMNLSGVSVRSVRDFYKIENSDILVIHDDLDLNFGALRFKRGGGSSGHNGLKSIDNHINSDYLRARIGIGHPKNAESMALKNKSESKILDSKNAKDLDSSFKDSTDSINSKDSAESLKLIKSIKSTVSTKNADFLDSKDSKKNITQNNPNFVIDYVLEKFSSIELEHLDALFQTTREIIDAFIRGENLAFLQNKYTRKT